MQDTKPIGIALFTKISYIIQMCGFWIDLKNQMIIGVLCFLATSPKVASVLHSVGTRLS